MANVQLENGYTKIANSILEALEKIKMSDCEHRVLYSILRRTYGEGKKFGWITPKLIHETTGIDQSSVSRALRSLEKRKMIISTWVKGMKYIGLQKDYDLWGTDIDLSKIMKPKKEMVVEDGSYRDISKEIILRKKKSS